MDTLGATTCQRAGIPRLAQLVTMRDSHSRHAEVCPERPREYATFGATSTALLATCPAA
jgi:hypothetical protein